MNIGGYQGEPSLFEIALDVNIDDILGGIALFALLIAGFWFGCGGGLSPDAAAYFVGGMQ